MWYASNPADAIEFEKQMRRKVHYVIQPDHLWASIASLARSQSEDLLETLREGFKYIENESFQSTFGGLFSEIDLGSPKLRAATLKHNVFLRELGLPDLPGG